MDEVELFRDVEDKENVRVELAEVSINSVCPDVQLNAYQDQNGVSTLRCDRHGRGGGTTWRMR